MATAHGLLILVLFHLLFFRRFYFQNPYCYATSELLEQCFPSTLHLGRHLRRSGLFTLKPVDDPYYYPDYSALPFLSSYYPPHRVVAWLMSFLGFNQAFLTICLTMVLHFLLCSLAVYALLIHLQTALPVALFASVTLSYLGYAMKQNSSIVYTLAWVPVFLLAMQQHLTICSGSSLGMMLLAGYWPIALYTIPLGCLAWLLG